MSKPLGTRIQSPIDPLAMGAIGSMPGGLTRGAPRRARDNLRSRSPVAIASRARVLLWALALLALVALGGCGGGSNLRSDAVSKIEYDTSGPFPVPEEIQPNVDFWRHVYGIWSRGQVAFHDNEHMGVVYEVGELPGTVQEGYTHEQRAWVKAREAMYRDQLRSLERKVRERTPLSSTDKALLAKIEQGAGKGAVYGASDRLRSQRGVRERFKRGLEISGRYDPYFRQIMSAKGVPDDLAYLPHVESSFQTHARSSVGAAGIWQFMPATGREYGMRVDRTIDERLDPITCADSAASYLSAAHRKLGSWPLAITSYNHGKGGMANAKAQYGDDIGKIVKHYKGRAFGFASRNFYASFAAAREVADHPQRYFPEGVNFEQPWSYERLVLRSPMPAHHVANHYGVSTASLARANLHWRDPAVDGRAQLPAGSTVWLPAGSTRRVAAHPPTYRDRISVPSTATLVVRNDSGSAKQAAKTGSVRLASTRTAKPTSAKASAAKPVSAKSSATAATTKPAPKAKYHVVKPQETLYRVAVTNGISVDKLRKLNQLDPNDNTIRVGQKLRVSG
ncbi:transglycosylase SLT domain-containing protein [Lamprobacter modestohalophilus]|uniref:lytic transglycosylase domain-containing protein n=1 Tax=Lamprobacter modestohalophilus TaxID=1064514 RepID=UPI002ADEED72|nr:transglycosylase SLT domain-containing protein [Lamprobacter modestohalophilus]MEA1050893.1 transglycosylase SLT domain-containing protein [Lamprobacter modestohalophilus]